MKSYERLSLFFSMGAGVGFLVNMGIGFNFKKSLIILCSLLLLSLFIFITGEFIFGLNKDIRKYNE